jgi:hypothetical protein
LGPKAATESLVYAIAEIGHGIHRARLTESSRSPDARSHRKEHLSKTTKMVSRLAALMQTTTPHIRDQLNVLLAPPTGLYLTVRAFEDAGTRIDTEVSIHTRFSREAMSRDGSYRAMEAEVAASRVLAAYNCACRVQSSVLEQLRSPIDIQIALMKSDTGGNPVRIHRRFAIWALADAYHQFLGNPPTTTSTGPFVRLCETVFPLFEIETIGLDQAVQRELAKWRKKSALRT